MRAKHVKTIHIVWILILYHSTGIPLWRVMIKREYISIIRLLIPHHLVKKMDSHTAMKWPVKLIIKFSTHQAYIHRNICAFTLIITIGIDLQVHLVALNMGVERKRKPAGTVPPICIKF